MDLQWECLVTFYNRQYHDHGEFHTVEYYLCYLTPKFGWSPKLGENLQNTYDLIDC